MEISAKLIAAVFVAPTMFAPLSSAAARPGPVAGSTHVRHAVTTPAAPMLGEAAQRGAPAIEPQRLDIRVNVRPSLPTALIEADLTFRVTESADSVVWFLRPDMNLDAIEDEDGLPLTYRRRRSFIRVTTPTLDRGAVIKWTFRYRARFSKSLEEAGQLLLTTPWYPHLRVAPDPEEFQRYVPMPMTMTSTLPDPWMLVSSGTPSVTDAESGAKTFTWRDSVPSAGIPLVVGRFAEWSMLDEVGTLRGFFPPEDRSVLEPYVRYMRNAAVFFTERMGPLRRRSWNLVAVDLPDNISGLTVPGITFMQRGNVNVDDAFPLRVFGHEIAHLWWNHHVEIPRARDAWLREGLPTYSSLLFLENEYGNQMMRLELERSRLVALAVDSNEALEVGFEMATPDAVYALNYHKAAIVLHMLREIIGLDGFADLCRGLNELREDITTDVFIREAETRYGDDLSWFFDSWLRSPDVPTFRIRYGFRQDEEHASRYRLSGTIEQSGAAIRFPALVRVPLEAAPPLETTVWIEPGVTEFSIVLPSPPRDLQFDPYGVLLYREATVEKMDARPPG